MLLEERLLDPKPQLQMDKIVSPQSSVRTSAVNLSNEMLANMAEYWDRQHQKRLAELAQKDEDL